MNAKIKKENGVVFTPDWVADFMLEEALNGQKNNGKREDIGRWLW